MSNFSVQPFPPVRGANLTFSVTGLLDEIITYGQGDVSIVLDGDIPLLNTSIDICLSPMLTCPVAAGKFHYASTVWIDDTYPCGSYKAKLVLTDQTKQQICCFEADFSLA